MLDTFRSAAGSLWAKILLTFLVLSFGVWGIGDMIRNPGGKVTLVTVGSATITSTDYLRAMHREGETIRRIMGENFSPDLLKDPALANHVLQQLINHSLIQQESEALGLVPGDADIVRRIRSNPAFQDNKGNFDKGIFEGMLKNSNISEKTYVDQLRQDIAANMLVDTLLSATPVSDTAVHTLYEAREESRTIALYELKPSLVTNVPTPDDTQLKAYYDSHNRDFTAPEFRSLSYVILSGADAAKNVKLSDNDLKAVYRERMEEFKRPERRTVEQLLYSSEESARKADAMLKNGKSFEQVAKETDILNKNALSLGKVERSAVIENAADKVFSLAVGQSTDPIQSPFGWHIFHVSSIEPPSVASFEEIRPMLEKEQKQRDADEGLNKLANQFEDELAGGNSLAETAKDFSVKMVTLPPMDRLGKTHDGAKSAGLPDLDKFLDVAFKTDEKTESPVTPAKGGVYYIVRVDKIEPERLRDLAEVKGQVISGWQKEERDRRLNAMAKDIGAKFATPAERNAVIEKFNLQPLAEATIKRSAHAAGNISLPVKLVADVFAHKPQTATNAYLTPNGDYLLAVVTNVVPAPLPDKEPKLVQAAAEIHQNLQSVTQNEILIQYTQFLKKKYPVRINESALQAVLK